jgi:hypothetical protein
LRKTPAVDGVDLLEPLGRAHEDLLVLHDEVLPFHDLDAHLPRQEGMLEVGAIINAGREQHDGRCPAVAGRDVLQDGEEVLRVVIDRPHADAAEKIGEGALHRHPVFQQVGDAGGAAAIVFQDVVGALAVADQVAAADVDVDILRHRKADHLGPEMFRADYILQRYETFLDDPLLGVDILEEKIQREHALLETFLNQRPFRRRNDAGHEVEGKNALGALLVAVAGEGDTLPQEGGIDRGTALLEFLVLQVIEAVEKRCVVGTHLRGRGEHLVKKIAGVVGVEQGHSYERDRQLTSCRWQEQSEEAGRVPKAEAARSEV